MKQYVLFIAMALLAIQFQSCSSGDDNLASSDELQQSVPPPTLSRAEILNGIQKGRISGGGNTVPKERTSFYTEYMPEVDWVSALGTFTARDEKGVVEVHDNLGGLVKTEDGATFTMNIKGKGLHYHSRLMPLDCPVTEKSSTAKAGALLQEYVHSLESVLKEHPEQWFNFYDFWHQESLRSL